MKTVFLFPGQGSQEVGMGRELFATDAHFQALVSSASDITEKDLEALCLRGPASELMVPQFLQPLLVAVSLGFLRQAEAGGLRADIFLGHSLGEITALAAAGTVTDEEAVAMAAKRGQLMMEVASTAAGAMLAVSGVPMLQLREELVVFDGAEELVVANDNAPEQIVLSGDRALLEEFTRWLSGRKLGRCTKIPVCVPCHSPKMSIAEERFRAWVERLEFRPPHTDLMMNATGDLERDPGRIRELITRQLTRPVLFTQCMARLKSLAVGRLIEIGSGRVLCGLARLNGFRENASVFSISNTRSLQRALASVVG